MRPLYPVLLLVFLRSTCAVAAAPPQPLTLVNPYPVIGAADIAGTSTMTRALRAMQSYATPSSTDALLQHLQRLLVSELHNEVAVSRNSRGGGEAAAREVRATERGMLLFAGSGLTAAVTLSALTELRPLARVAHVPLALVLRSDDAVIDIAQWLTRSQQRAAPQIGSPGDRTIGQWVARQLQRGQPRHAATVTYNGGNGAMRGLLAMQVGAVVVPLPAVLPYVAGQRLHIPALASAARHPLLPGVPTFAEAGLGAAYAEGWHGLFAAPELEQAAVGRVQQALQQALQSADARAALAGLGYVAAWGDATALRHELREEARRIAEATAVQPSVSSGGLTE